MTRHEIVRAEKQHKFDSNTKEHGDSEFSGVVDMIPKRNIGERIDIPI